MTINKFRLLHHKAVSEMENRSHLSIEKWTLNTE